MDSYDCVIVGAGISGALVAKKLGLAGKRVLVLEAGESLPPTQRAAYLDTFYNNAVKTPESPYPPANGAFRKQPDPPPDRNVVPPDQQPNPRAATADLFSSNVNPNYRRPTPPSGDDPAAVRAFCDDTEGEYIFEPDKSYLLQKGPLPFLSTYERNAGGTMWHWLGTSLRNVEHDFSMKTTYGVMRDWPASVYPDLTNTYYNEAEREIGVAASKTVQEKDLGQIGLEYAPSDYQYPLPEIPMSLVDEGVRTGLGPDPNFLHFEGLPIEVTPTPAGRNSQPYQNRRVCAGNTNCIPICPIQAKYDPTVTLAAALQTGNVTLQPQSVASKVNVDTEGNISGVDYLTWDYHNGSMRVTGRGKATGTLYVLAAHAIETPRLLLMSADDSRPGLARGVANSSGMVGKNLMDHPLYLSWALMPSARPVWGFRGPLATAGIESLRDGAFRSERAAWRVEIGNEGWNFSSGDPWTSTLDWIMGTNNAQVNTGHQQLFGAQLVQQLNDVFTRQWRMGFLVEQTPEPTSCVTLSRTLTDGLGLPRPVIHYVLSDYTKRGFAYAEIFARQVYKALGARCYTQNPQFVPGPNGTTVENPSWFALPEDLRQLFSDLPDDLKTPDVTNLPASSNGVPDGFRYFGSGHIVGTTVMGDDKATSVLDADQRSWDHKNLFVLGSNNFPTVATANPTLTIAAMGCRAADAILKQLG